MITARPSTVLKLTYFPEPKFVPSPQRNLLVAVLERAIRDLDRIEHKLDTVAWFMNLYKQPLSEYGSFGYICQTLNYSPDAILEALSDKLRVTDADLIAHEQCKRSVA